MPEENLPEGTPEAKAAPMPLLYRRPEILNAPQHGALTLKPTGKFGFAAKVNCVPVVLEEMSKLVAHYPVIFTTGEEPLLMAATGLRNDENLYVDAEGTWEPETYIPAYVRRYPFILTEMPDKKFALAAETGDADFFSAGGAPLFADGKPTQVAADAFRFCDSFQKSFEETREFCKAIRDAGLLEPKTCTVTLPNSQPFNLSGFSVVNAKALDEIDNHHANEWRKRHWLGAVYLHLASLDSMRFLAVREAKRQAKA